MKFDTGLACVNGARTLQDIRGSIVHAHTYIDTLLHMYR